MNRTKKWGIAEVLFALSILILIVIVALPVLLIFWTSFVIDGHFNLSGIIDVIGNPDTYEALRMSLLLAAAVTVTCTFVGTLFAWLVTRTDMPFKETMKVLFTIPFMLPAFIGALAWKMLLSPRAGYINQLWMALFETRTPLFNIYSFWGIVIIETMYLFPFVFIQVSGALERMDPTLEESARIAGAGLFTITRKITIPLILPAVVSGALREWLMTRGESVSSRTQVRALVPVSVRGSDGSSGNNIAAFLVDLPVGEPQAVVRLHRISYEMEQLKSTGQMVGAQALVGVAGFAPPTLHSLGARTANGLSKRMFNLVVTNVPGPQFPLYAGGAEMLGAYPVVPLAKGQAVAIGLTSYNGGVFFGLNADRDAMTDVDVLAECLESSLAELLETVPRKNRPKKAAPAPKPAPRTAAKSERAASGTGTVVRPAQVKSAPSRGLVARPADPPSRRTAAADGD